MGYHTQVGAAARDACNDGGLVEGVRETADGDGRVGAGNGGDLVEEPGGSLGARGRAVVTVVVAVPVRTMAKAASNSRAYLVRVWSQLWGLVLDTPEMSELASAT
jgi:hypothetical protein